MTRTNWTRAEIADLFDLPFTELVFRAAEVHRAHHATGEVQLCTLLVDQDRRLPRGLRLLLAIGARQVGPQGREIDGRRRGAGRGGGGQGARLAALLHGRGVARAQGPRHGQGLRDGRGREGHGAGNLHDARHAHGHAGTAAQGRRPRLLQPQYRHLARTLWRDHHDADLPGAARHAGGSAQRRDQRLLRRDRRHGREPRRPGRLHPRAGDAARAIPKACRSTRWCRSRARCWATCSPASG